MRPPGWIKISVLGCVMAVGLPASARADWVLEYDSQQDENTIGGTAEPYPWGELGGSGISSWYFIAAAPDAKISRLSLYVSGITGAPTAYDWVYQIQIGPTEDAEITDDPDSQVSAYTIVHGNWNPKNTLGGSGWYNVDLQVPYLMNSGSNYIIKFAYVSGGSGLTGATNYWRSTADRLDHDCFALSAGGGTVHDDELPRLRMYGNRPDLFPHSFTVTPDVLWSGRLAYFTVQIWNVSWVDIPESYEVALKYQRVGDSEWSYMGSTRTVQGHGARRHEILSWPWLPDGAYDYWFQVEVDVNNTVLETNENNNELSSIPGYPVRQAPSPPITTMILADSWMMTHRGYAQADVDTLMDDLADLAANDPRGRGVVIDIADFDLDSDLCKARDEQWDAHMGDKFNTKAGTNAYVEELDRLIEHRLHYSYPDLKQVIIVGSHEIIPMYVRSGESGGSKEQGWTSAYSYGTDMYYLYEYDPDGAPGNYITDAKYADVSYLDDSKDAYLTRELVVSRLVETPTQISGVIDNYLAVSAINPMDDIAVIGSFEFKDGAYKAAGHLEDVGYTPDKTLIGDSFVSTSVPTKINAKDDFVYIGGHGDYNAIASDAERDENDDLTVNDEFMAGSHATRGDTDDLNALPTAVIISVACHAGALMPNMTHPAAGPGTQYHDFPEEFASKGVIAYLGATGYTWITKNDGGPEDTKTSRSEQLCSEVTRRFAWGRTIGESYRKAANDYYLDNKDSLDNIDRKVLGVHQLYGLPGYKRDSSGIEPPSDGWHWGGMNRQMFGDKVVVQATLHIDSYSIEPDGTVVIPGVSYTGGPQTPNLPVIRYEEPDPLPPGAHLTRVQFHPSASWGYDHTSIVPTIALAQRDGWLPAEPFTHPGLYPAVPCSGYTILNAGGEDATVGLVIHPVQFDPNAWLTRVWQEMALEFEYDLSQVSFYDSFADGDLDPWTVTQTGAATGGLDYLDPASTPYCLQIVGASAQNDRVKVESGPIGIDFAKPYRIECQFRYTSFHWDRFLVFGHVRLLLDQAHLPLLYDPIGDNSFVGHAVGPAFNSYAPASTWMSINVDVDPATHSYTIRIHDAEVGTVTYADTLEPSPTIWFEDNGSADNFLNARYDDFLVGGSPEPGAPDFDRDGDVDEDDWNRFEACATGPAITPPGPGCGDKDLDGDGDVDQSDFGLFQRCYVGPEELADPSCVRLPSSS